MVGSYCVKKERVYRYRDRRARTGFCKRGVCLGSLLITGL